MDTFENADFDDPFGADRDRPEKLSAAAAQAEKDGIIRVTRNARGAIVATELIRKAERTGRERKLSEAELDKIEAAAGL